MGPLESTRGETGLLKSSRYLGSGCGWIPCGGTATPASSGSGATDPRYGWGPGHRTSGLPPPPAPLFCAGGGRSGVVAERSHRGRKVTAVRRGIAPAQMLGQFVVQSTQLHPSWRGLDIGGSLQHQGFANLKKSLKLFSMFSICLRE